MGNKLDEAKRGWGRAKIIIFGEEKQKERKKKKKKKKLLIVPVKHVPKTPGDLSKAPR